jgi:hypothetical protein
MREAALLVKGSGGGALSRDKHRALMLITSQFMFGLM